MVGSLGNKLVFNSKYVFAFRNRNFCNEVYAVKSINCVPKPWSILYKKQSRLFHTTSVSRAVLLSPQDVNLLLRAKEFTKEFSSGSVKAYDSNQLPSNNPIEDTHCEAQCLLTTGLLFGIFDGHGGGACAQAISKRLFNYIAASLLPTDVLHKYITSQNHDALIKTFNDKSDIVQDLKPLYEKSFKTFLTDLSQNAHKENFEMTSALETAFLRLDEDFSKEVQDTFQVNDTLIRKTLSVAVTGAVVCVAHIDGQHLHIANVGDCNAVLGSLSEHNYWISKKLCVEHNTDNIEEVKRILSEHPENESDSVIKSDRLLGQLAPLRALGDYKYKWPRDIMEKVAVPYLGPHVIPPSYHTPPYLSSKPDVYHYQLTPKDKFMVIASDGLWDMMTPEQVVMLVGEHMMGKVFFTPLKLQQKDMQLGDINQLLLYRKESLKSKPIDKNAATHLLRHALGGTDYGIEHARLSQMLTLPPDVSRLVRDDISISVVYFDSDFMRNSIT